MEEKDWLPEDDLARNPPWRSKQHDEELARLLRSAGRDRLWEGIWLGIAIMSSFVMFVFYITGNAGFQL